MPATILIVDDERHTREGLEQALEDDYDVFVAGDAEEAFTLMGEEDFDVVLTDLRMAGKDGMKVIDHSLKMPYQPICIMMTAYGSVDTAVEAMKRGATDFLTKPVNLNKLEIVIERALKNRDVVVENQQLHKRLDDKYTFDGIIGESFGLKNVLEKVELVAPSKATVLLVGETGTGKELIAQAVHQNSNQANQPFVAVHCAALPSNLLESELFGYEKGAFTGATERRIGRFEAADGGTLFLDEIGEIDASTQVKLLRFLETRSFERLGSIEPITVNVRLVCATNKNLSEMVAQDEFREDLYYRLNVVTIDLPPLRERKEDIPVLISHYIDHFTKENGYESLSITSEAMSILVSYNWAGNIRELKNLCENLVVMHRGGEITAYDLDGRFRNQTATLESKPSADKELSVEENKKWLLRNALQKANGNKTEAAKLLGISRRTLYRQLKDWPELEV